MSLSVKSYTMCSRMSRSATKPSARKTTTTGTSVWMYGSVARMWPPSTCPREGFWYICMYIVLVGRAPLSTCERHSTTHENLCGCDLRKQYTWLLLMCSCATSTFSEPLMTK